MFCVWGVAMADVAVLERALEKQTAIADCLALERMLIYVTEELKRLGRNEAAELVRKGLLRLQSDLG
jgi:hypothetical protein